jgi:phosphate-selective porin
MKKIFTVLFMATAYLYGYAQVQVDSLQEQVSIQEGRINALDERIMVTEGDLDKLRKIKVSGYIQAQFEAYQGGLILKENDPKTSFFIRRARIKFTYEATDGIRFVLQPDFSTGNLSLKDAYAMAYLPKLRSLTLWAGQFNRPNYEVEYSSSQREVLERSRMIRTIYPGEREVGAKLEFNPSKFPLKMQLAVLNGNFKGTELLDVDSKKDLMARATYSFALADNRVGIDVGAHGYFGGLMAKNKYVQNYENVLDSLDTNKGTYLDKKWGGAEFQAFFDWLGGMSLKGEYIAGRNAYPGDSKTNPYKTKQFSGYYIYLIKNIGKKNQFATRFDNFDPNTTLSGDAAGKDVYYNTFNFAWQYYLNDNIRFTLNYAIPLNEKNATYPEDIKDNAFSIRVQAKF